MNGITSNKIKVWVGLSQCQRIVQIVSYVHIVSVLEIPIH